MSNLDGVGLYEASCFIQLDGLSYTVQDGEQWYFYIRGPWDGSWYNKNPIAWSLNESWAKYCQPGSYSVVGQLPSSGLYFISCQFSLDSMPTGPSYIGVRLDYCDGGRFRWTQLKIRKISDTITE